MSAFKGRINSGFSLHATSLRQDYMSVSIKKENDESYSITTVKPPSRNFNFREIQNVTGEKSKYFKMNAANNQSGNTNADILSELKRKYGNINVDICIQLELENNELEEYLNESQDSLETFRVFTGTVDRAIKWRKIYPEFHYVEVFAVVVSIQESKVGLQKVILLKDKRGPVLQVQYYASDHIDIQNFYIGQELRCVGHMIGENVLHAFSIRNATAEELANLQRLLYICDHTVARSASNS